MGNSCDLFYQPPPLFPCSQLYLLRPLLPPDKVRPRHEGVAELTRAWSNETRAHLLLPQY